MSGVGSISQRLIVTELTARAEDAPSHHRVRRAAATEEDMPIQLKYARLGLTSEIVEGFRATFMLFDKDGSGAISASEIMALFGKIGQPLDEEEVMGLIEASDTDHSGSIEFDEFLVMMVKRMENQPLNEVDVLEAFRVFDRDGNNEITREELQMVVRNIIGEDAPQEVIDVMFEEADEDNLGFITYEQFVRIMEWGELNGPLHEQGDKVSQFQAATEDAFASKQARS